MGTKTILLLTSWILTYVNMAYIPLDWRIIDINIKIMCYGLCWGYCAWLIWYDQVKIYSILEAIYFIKKDKVIQWWASL